MDKKYKKLAGNTIIFFIGTFGSKVLSFLIVPLYTYVLTPAEYGQIDLFTTAIRMMVPFTSIMFADAILRFVASEEIDKGVVVSNGFVVFLYGTILTVSCIPLYKAAFNLGSTLFLYVIALILNTYTSIFPHYLRAVGKNMSFAINGVIQTVTMLGFNVYFLLICHLGIKGYLYALVLSQLASAVFVTISGRILYDVSFSNVDFKVLKEMLAFCIPIIPNSLMWWLMSAGDKYVINFFMGDTANGLYSIALKVPTIISMLYSVFAQAWQLSAIEEMRSKDETIFYNKIFGILSVGLCFSVALVIPVIRPLFCLVLNESYHSTWKYASFLCVAAILDCFESFASVTYSITKKTGKAVIATSIGIIANIVINLMLINKIGLYGVAIGTLIGNSVVMKIRLNDMYHDMGIFINTNKLNISIVILIVESVITIVVKDAKWNVSLIIFAIIIACLYRSELIGAVSSLRRSFMKRNNKKDTN